MGKRDKRIDAYIAKAQPFAKPILNHFRELVHKACPEVGETLKWSMPHFEYKGAFCGMASFKQHMAIGFWKASLMKDPAKIFAKNGEKESMGHLGRISSIKDLPSDKILLQYIKEAVKLNDEGVKLPSKKAKPKKELVIPDYFMKAISKNKKALKTFENFSYSHKKEYIEWITSAKTDQTRQSRLEQAIVWMREGKARNWKYVNS